MAAWVRREMRRAEWGPVGWSVRYAESLGGLANWRADSDGRWAGEALLPRRTSSKLGVRRSEWVMLPDELDVRESGSWRR